MSESEKKLASTQEIQEVIKAIADTELLVSEITVGFSFSEITQLVAVIDDVPKVIADASLVIPQWEGLDDAGRAELVAYVQQNCKYPTNVTVEGFTQKVLEAAVLLSKIYQVFAPPQA